MIASTDEPGFGVVDVGREIHRGERQPSRKASRPVTLVGDLTLTLFRVR